MKCISHPTEQLLDIQRLHSGQKVLVRDSFIRRFRDYNGLLKYAEDVEDYEILGKCLTVTEYKESIPNHVETMR